MIYSTRYRGYYITVTAQILASGGFRMAKISVYDSKDLETLHYYVRIHQDTEGYYTVGNAQRWHITTINTMRAAIDCGLSHIKENIDCWIDSKNEAEKQFKQACDSLGLILQSDA